jgi:hypothetical protein
MYEQYTYKNFTIYHNSRGNKFDAPFISIVNPNIRMNDGHNAHCHVTGGDKYAKQIVDMAIQFRKYGCITHGSISMRDKACRLNGLKIMEKY